MAPLRALVALPAPPLREGGAAGRCAIGLLRGLAANDVAVTAVAARESWASAGTPPDGLPVTVVELPAPEHTLAARLEALARPIGTLGRGAFAEALQAAASEADVLHLDEIATGRCFVPGVPTVLHLHYAARIDRPLVAPWKPELRELVEFARAERAALRRHRHIVVSSPV